jgi:NosR/NirI family transcriptional regulator, nitrous oxide reductase regulator
MRIPVVLGSLLLAGTIIVGGQTAIDAKLYSQLKRLFPAASTFSPKSGAPPHFKAYVNDAQSGAPKLVGLAFWTTELEPLERGYDGPIKILVGMGLNGILTGIVVTDHHEPYGYFSVDTAGFAAQFAGKSITDPFSVGRDIDAISRASLSVTSASRAVRNSARRIARELLPQPPK